MIKIVNRSLKYCGSKTGPNECIAVVVLLPFLHDATPLIENRMHTHTQPSCIFDCNTVFHRKKSISNYKLRLYHWVFFFKHQHSNLMFCCSSNNDCFRYVCSFFALQTKTKRLTSNWIQFASHSLLTSSYAIANRSHCSVLTLLKRWS